MNEELLQKLYSKYNLSQKGSYEQFKTDMADSAIQRRFFDKYGLSQKGSFEQFQTDIGGVQQQLPSPFPEQPLPTTGGQPGLPVQEERSILGALPLVGDIIHYGGKAVERGFYSGQTADVINPYTSAEEITPEAIQDVARYQQEIQKRGEPAFVKEGIWTSLTKRPLTTLTELITESLASTATHGATRIAGGAAIGAGIGATGLGVGAVPGAATGAMAAGVEAGGNVEYSAKILQSLSEMGIDTTNPDDIVRVFTDPQLNAELKDKALKKAIPIMAFDALSAGIAGKFLGKAISRGTSKAVAGLKEMGTQMATGASGELAGQISAGEPIDFQSISAEAIGELGGGGVETLTGTVANKPATKQETVNKIVASIPVEPSLAQQQDAIFNEGLQDLNDAFQEPSTTGVDVRQQTTDGNQVAEENTQETGTTQEGQVTELPENIIVHSGPVKITKLDPNQIKGGVRSTYGKGVYFTDSPSKAADYGTENTYLDKSKLSILDTKQPLNSDFVNRIKQLAQSTSDSIKSVIYDMYAGLLQKEIDGGRTIDEARKNIFDRMTANQDDRWNMMLKDLGYDTVKNGYEYVVFDYEKANQFLTELPAKKPKIRVQGELVTPEQQEFTSANEQFQKEVTEFGDATPETKTRLQVAQQALQEPAKPSKAANAADLIRSLEKDGPVPVEGLEGSTFFGRIDDIISALGLDPQDPKAREIKAVATSAPKNAKEFNNLITKLKEVNQTDTTTITKKSLRDQLREAWRQGISLGVKDAETRNKNLVSQALDIIKEAGAKLPAAKYEAIIRRIKSVNTKNEGKVLEMLDYVSRVAENAKAAEQIEQIEKLQDKVKAKKGVLPESQQRLVDKLAKINPTDISDLDEFVGLLNDLAANMIAPGKPERGAPVEATRLETITNKAYNEYIDAVRNRAIDSKQASNDLFADEKSMEDKEATERGILYAEVNSLIPFVQSIPGRIKSKASEVLQNITDAHLERLSLDEVKQLIRGIEQVVKNGDFSNLAKVYPLLYQIQNSHRYDNIRNLAPGSKSAIGKTVPAQKLANLSQVFEYLYNGLSASAAKLAQWSGVRDIVNGAAQARSREHEYRVKIDDLRKQIEKGTKVDLNDPENLVRLDVYGEFASQMDGIEDAQMLENAMYNWRTSSEYYKRTGDPDNIRVAKIIDQMLLLFDGAKTVDQVKSRMEEAYPEVKNYKDGISNIMEELTPEIKEVAETVLGKQPRFYKPGTYWPQSTQYTGESPLDTEQYPLGIKLALPDNLIERVPKLQKGQARKIRGVEGVMQSIAESLDAIEVGEGRNMANAFLNLDAREGNKYLGASQTNVALGTLLRESFSQKVQGSLFDRSLNTIRRIAAATVLTGIKSAVSQYIPTMLRTISDFGLKKLSQGKMPNIFMNGTNTPSAKKLRSFYAISKRGERALGTYVGDISKIEKSYTGVNKFRDKAADFIDDVLRRVGQVVPKYTFNFADASAAERAWTTAYLDYLDSQGVDISKSSTDEFWANEVSKKNDPVRKEAAAAAEQYVSTNQMESGSLETPPVYKTQQLINAIIPFTKYLTGKATVMSNRMGTLIGGVTNGRFGTPNSTKQETVTAARQLAADYTELVAFHAIVKHLLLYPLQDAIVNSYLESLDLEPEDEETLAKRNKTRTGYSLMELVTSGAIPIVPLVIISQVLPDSLKADAWNAMLEKIGKEEDQTTKEFRETTELPVVPEAKDAQQMLGILGVLESQASLNQDWKYQRIDGSPYIIYKDMKGDTITKAISEEEADALDNSLLISLYGVLGLKDIADVMKQVERIVARRAMKSKQQTVLP